MKATLFAAGYTGYLIFGLFQIAATASGIEHFTGLWWFMCWIGAILIGWVPVVGTALGIYGAHAQWEWSLPASYALFIGLPILLFVPLLTVSVSAAIRRRTEASRARHGTA
jgi:heme/copper-type cytochrome/quinol oxidase subunit 2